MLEFIKNFKKSIGYILIKKVYLTYFIIMIIFMFYQIFSEYDNNKKEAYKQFYKVEKVYKDLFSKYHIEKDNFAFDEITKTIFKTSNISGLVAIDSSKNFKFFKGAIGTSFTKDVNERNKDVSFYEDNYFFKHRIKIDVYDKKDLELILFIKKTDIYNLVWDTVFLILLNMIFGMIILWVLFSIFTAKYLIKPLNTIIDATNKFDIEEHEFIEINLDDLQNNEFYKLSNVFNKMSKRINEAYINMEQLSMIKEIQKNKLENQKTELIQANKSKDDFLANMSHELKTPLNSINVISDVMMRNKTENLDEKQIKNIGIINKCGKDLLYLINDVLDISKLEAGQIILNNDTINIKDLIMSIYDMFYPQTKAKEIDFVLKVDDSLETMYSDEDRIKQIIKNLLSNALKFTESGKISLIVKDEDKDIKVIVKDEGIGIPEDKLENIFDRFKQVDGSTTRKYGGTGLGLAICKELAHLLKGDITVTSELGKGSTFELIICKNIDLMNTLNLLDIKDESTQSTNSTSVLKEIDGENIFINFDDSEDIKKELILVYNNEPIKFFSVIMDLNKLYEVKQSANLSEIKELYNKRTSKVIVDISSLNSYEVDNIVQTFAENLILIYKNEIDLELSKKVYKVIQEPLNYEKIINIKKS